ncbi:MAG: hypothetical protein IH594_06315 [Bacteroidales bacterium]|nr:hypothetical protein [Bacteroidales bacterium]
MNAPETKLIFAAIFFLLVFITGIWMKIKGHPYPVLQVTIHKLLSLFMIVFLVLFFFNFDKIYGFNSIHRILLFVAFLSSAGSMATGAILTARKQISGKFVKYMHTIFWLLIIGNVSYILCQLI